MSESTPLRARLTAVQLSGRDNARVLHLAGMAETLLDAYRRSYGKNGVRARKLAANYLEQAERISLAEASREAGGTA
jgi:hypothetical protein